jgi:hypothetical protein
MLVTFPVNLVPSHQLHAIVGKLVAVMEGANGKEKEVESHNNPIHIAILPGLENSED